MACGSQRPCLMSTLIRRVELLEKKMDRLADLPVRMSQVEEGLGVLRADVRNGFARVWTEFGRVWTEFDKVREEIRTGDEETRHQMRILHEDVIARLKLLGEGIDRLNGRPTRGRSPRRDR